MENNPAAVAAGETLNPFVSVVIPTYNDAEGLQRCLRLLQKQTYPADRYEIIVVDNASAESIEPITSQFANVRAAYEARRSSYAARNKGLELATGEVIALLDSDCITEPDWIEKGVHHLLTVPDCGFVAGGVYLVFKDPQHPSLAELYEDATLVSMQEWVNKHHSCGAGNIFVLRSTFDKVGPFDANLKSAGDTEWARRVYAAGYTLHYNADTKVGHPARHTLRELHNRRLRIARGTHQINRQPYSLAQIVRGIPADLKPPLSTLRQVYAASQIKGVFRKTQVALVALYIHYLRVWVKWHLRLRDRLQAGAP